MFPVKVPAVAPPVKTLKPWPLVPELALRVMNDWPLVTAADQFKVPPPLFVTVTVWGPGDPPPATCPVNVSEVGETLIVGTGAGLTVIVRVLEAVFCGLLTSVTVTVKLNVPTTVGVPRTVPEEELIPMPLGRPLADHVYGVWPPVAATACCAAYPVPTVAVGGLSAVVVIESAGVEPGLTVIVTGMFTEFVAPGAVT